MDYNGIILINKPPDITSFKVCEIVKKKLKIKKVGHGGTLDPFAAGLLILGINKGTKLLNVISDYPKEYTGTIVLGEKRDTFDVTGKIVDICEEEKLQKITEDDILKIKEKFTGAIKQKPPQYSAIKKHGKPLYKYAREGKFVDIPHRTVFIEKFEIRNFQLPEFVFSIKCSKGTYIRSIANDMGEELGVFGFLKELKRVSINGFSVDESVNLDELSKDDLIHFDNALRIKKVFIRDEYNSLLENGNIINMDFVSENDLEPNNNELIYIFGKNCSVVGRFLSDKNIIKPEIVYKKLYNKNK